MLGLKEPFVLVINSEHCRSVGIAPPTPLAGDKRWKNERFRFVSGIKCRVLKFKELAGLVKI